MPITENLVEYGIAHLHHIVEPLAVMKWLEVQDIRQAEILAFVTTVNVGISTAGAIVTFFDLQCPRYCPHICIPDSLMFLRDIYPFNCRGGERNPRSGRDFKAWL